MQKRQLDQPSKSDSIIRTLLKLIEDDFIDDDTFDFPPVRVGVEKSRHFVANERREALQPRDMLAGCDEFERKSIDDCFNALKLLRNNVRR